MGSARRWTRDGDRRGRGAGGERSHTALQVWISGDLPCDPAWREGSSVRVVRPLDLAALVLRSPWIQPRAARASAIARCNMGEPLEARGEPRRDPTCSRSRSRRASSPMRPNSAARWSASATRSTSFCPARMSPIRGEAAFLAPREFLGGFARRLRDPPRIRPRHPGSLRSAPSRTGAHRRPGRRRRLGSAWRRRRGGRVADRGHGEPEATATAPAARTDAAQPPTGALPRACAPVRAEPRRGLCALAGRRGGARRPRRPPRRRASATCPT